MECLCHLEMAIEMKVRVGTETETDILDTQDIHSIRIQGIQDIHIIRTIHTILIIRTIHIILIIRDMDIQDIKEDTVTKNLIS